MLNFGVMARAIGITAIGFFALLFAADAQADSDDTMVVTLLGTGTPSLKPDRMGSANLVEAGGLKLLFDAGRGASIRMVQAGVKPGELDAVFVTHFHSDHVNGLADIYTVGYITASTLVARTGAFELYGPEGTQRLADGLLLAHQSDAETRVIDEGVAKVATEIRVHEFDEGVVFEKNGVQVTAFNVLHGENIKPSVGYRVDFAGRSVVFSGDTKYDQNVVKYGKGVDLLVHEVAMATPALSEREVIQKVLAHHTSPTEAGLVFRTTAPRLAVYTHMVLLGLPAVDEVIRQTREHYEGPLVIGEDLMQFIIGSKGVTVRSAGD